MSGGASVEQRLLRRRVLGQLGVDDFAGAVRVERRAAILAIFRIEQRGVAEDVLDAGVAQFLADLLDRIALSSASISPASRP
jgi:hypothetical protein